MSFLFRGDDDKKTAPEWRFEVDGLMSHFKDESDEVPITRQEWEDKSYTDKELKLFKDR